MVLHASQVHVCVEAKHEMLFTAFDESRESALSLTTSGTSRVISNHSASAARGAASSIGEHPRCINTRLCEFDRLLLS